MTIMSEEIMKVKETVEAISKTRMHSSHIEDATHYAFQSDMHFFPNLSREENRVFPHEEFKFTLDSINIKNLRLIMEGCKKEKKVRNWEFDVSHPDMIHIDEIGESVTRQDPIVVIQQFRVEEYSEIVERGKGKNRKEHYIFKYKNIPIDDTLTVLIHRALIKKADIIGDTFLYPEELETTNIINVYKTTATKKGVEEIISWAKRIKNASYGEKVDKQFIRVVVRKI